MKGVLRSIKHTNLKETEVKYVFLSFSQICVNDDLVAKKFAYYSRHPTQSNGLDGGDWLPVMLSSSILTQTASRSSDRQMAQSSKLSCQHTGTTWENTELQLKQTMFDRIKISTYRLPMTSLFFFGVIFYN